MDFARFALVIAATLLTARILTLGSHEQPRAEKPRATEGTGSALQPEDPPSPSQKDLDRTSDIWSSFLTAVLAAIIGALVAHWLG